MTTTADNRPLSASEQTDALALVHHTFAYIPQQSLVLIGLADGCTGAHLRVDLDPVIRAESATAHQLADYLCYDEQHTPEALLIIVLDQQGRYSAEEHSALVVEIEDVFAPRDVIVAAEHLITDDHDAEQLSEVLQQHPQLSTASSTPAEEAAQWLRTATAPQLSEEEHEQLTARLTSRAVSLLIEAEAPDWTAIEQLDSMLHTALPPVRLPARDTVIALKALIEHAKGRGTATTAFLAYVDDPEHVIVHWASRVTSRVHPFARERDTSYGSSRL